MSDAQRLVSVIKRASKDEAAVSDIVLGTVKTIDPISVQIDKIILSAFFLIVPAERQNMQVGDVLQLLKLKRGQKYYVLNNATRAMVVSAEHATSADTASDAEKLNGKSANYYLAASSYTGTDIISKLQAIPDVGSTLLDEIKKYDGSTSGLDSDLLDGKEGSYYTDYANSVSGTFVSVKAFGCVGDGVTDDTTNFQAAINGAISNGKILYIDPGNYLITDRLLVDSTLSMVGGSHKTSILQFRGTYHEETDFDEDWWVESNACLLLTGNNCRLENFSIYGGTSKYDATDSNGIIFHYVGTTGDYYASSERHHITQVDVRYCKNGIFTYAGWNRYITCCQFFDNAQNGIKWYPLELSTVGSWSASGDVLIANQFIGNAIAGINATSLFEVTAWNCVFEYNGRAIIANNCNDITFKNCWNEANADTILVQGSAKFEGGYNINPSTVTHVPTGGDDIVVFEGKGSTVVYHGSVVRFNQQGGIITKGVELSVELDNLFSNPGFVELSQGTEYIPSLLGWSVYGNITADGDVQYLSNNSAHFSVSSYVDDAFFGIRQDILIEPGQSFNISFYAMSPDRSTIDGTGITLYLTLRNASGDVVAYDNRYFSLTGNDVWEEKTAIYTQTGDIASVGIGLGCGRNGNVYFSQPMLADADAMFVNNLYTRDKDEDSIAFLNMSGIEIGSVPKDPTTKQDVAVADLHAETVESELAYLEGLAEGALPSTGTAADSSKLNGQDASYYQPAVDYTADDVLTKIKTVDGTGSGLDADLLDGNEASAFASASHSHSENVPYTGATADVDLGTNGFKADTLHVDKTNHRVGINTSTPTEQFEVQNLAGADAILSVRTGDVAFKILNKYGYTVLEHGATKVRLNYNNNEFEFEDGGDLKVGATTGSRLGTAALQKLAFWGATPVVQQAHIADASASYTTGDLDTEAEIIAAVNALGAKLNTILALLETLGLMASS